MRLLLVNPPQNTRYPQPPMGLALLGAILERDGHHVKIVDANISKYWRSEVLEQGTMSDMVGLTAMTPTVSQAIAIANNIKEVIPRMTIVLGGVHATLMPEQTLKACYALSIIVKGEGDKAILDILGSRVSHSYIVYGDSNDDLDSLPYLGYHLLSWGKYKPHPPHGRARPWLPMLTSRGCVFRCSYCCHGVFGDRFRAQSPARVVDEIDYMQKAFRVREIAFYDDVFTLDKKRAYAIADEILKRGIKVCWTCETRADLVNAELLKHMKKAGCYSISYGIESGSQEILDIIGKGISVEQSEEAVRLTREAGIEAIGYFMIGSPDETPDTIRETIDFAKRLKLDYAQFAVTTPLPGTRLWGYYMDGHEGKDVAWDKLMYARVGSKTSPIFESKALSRGDIEGWVSRAYAEFYLRPSYVWQRLRSIRSVGDAMVAVRGMKMLSGM